MYGEALVVTVPKGFAGRSLDSFLTKARTFESTEIWVEYHERRANAKSLLGMLSLAIQSDDSIKIIAAGSDEKEAVEQLKKFIENGCKEEE